MRGRPAGVRGRGAAAAVFLSGAFAGSVFAQGAPYPAKPIRMVVSLAPGGGVDVSTRLIAQKLSDAWGQPVVVENRPGAGGTIASELIAKSPPDGYTLVMATVSHSITPALYKLPFDAVRDFTPVTLTVFAPSVMAVHPSLPVRSVRDLVAFARARPGQLLFSSSGNGSPQHLAMELFNRLAGVKLVHVPYKGTAPSLNDLIGGRVSVTVASGVSTMPHVQAGRLRALAVTSAKRAQGVPDLPTIAEAGVPGFAVETWYALLGPAGMPRDVTVRLHEEIARILAQPEMRERLVATGLDPVGLAPDPFAAYLRDEVAKWGRLVREAGIRID